MRLFDTVIKYKKREKKMKRGNKRIIAVLTLMFVVLIGTTVFGADEEAKYVPQLFGTFWALVPPLVAIIYWNCNWWNFLFRRLI